jgi:GTP-binding protein
MSRADNDMRHSTIPIAPMTDTFTAAELEAGRLLFAGSWQFIHAAASVGTLPAMAGLEIAVAGRSNVGKSSLINALAGRRALARTSHTPGRTQELIFFSLAKRLALVDMPGYGYAAAPRAKVAAWTELIHAYLAARANLARVYVLIDARHGLKPTDAPVLDELSRAAVSYQIVLTKADQVTVDALAACVAGTAAAISRRAAAFPDIIATSSRTGQGIPELRAAIARLVAERD